MLSTIVALRRSRRSFTLGLTFFWLAVGLRFVTSFAFAQSYTNPITGVVSLDSIVSFAPSQSVTFQFHPSDGSQDIYRTASISQTSTPPGAFRFTDVPANQYRVRVKGAKWLASAKFIDTHTGSPNLSIFLPAGDANDDNFCDVLDFGTMVNAYGTKQGDANYDSSADFNCDGAVDVLDFGLIVNNYGSVGDWLEDVTLAFPQAGPLQEVVGGQGAVTCVLTVPAAYRDSTVTVSLQCSRSDALALVMPQADSGTISTTVPAISSSVSPLLASSAVSWSAVPNTTPSKAAGTFSLRTSAVNYKTKVFLVATYTDANGVPAQVSAPLTLKPTRLWVSDVYLTTAGSATSEAMDLQWDTIFDTSNYSYAIQRTDPTNNLVSFDVTNVPNQTFTDAQVVAGTTYKYTLVQTPNSDPANPNPTSYSLAHTIATPMVVTASQNQAVDSRIDKRYAGTAAEPEHLLDFQFGNRTYKGGLFAGYANDPDSSRRGRSFSQYLFPLASGATTSLPVNRPFLTGDSNGYFLGQAAQGQPASSLACYALSNASNSWYCQDDTTHKGIVWSQSLPLMQGASLMDTRPTPTMLDTDPNSPTSGQTLPAPKQWMHWNLNDSLSTTLHGSAASGNLLSLVWAGAGDNSDKASTTAPWAYFAKNEYDASLGPRITYALGTIALEPLYFERPDGSTDGIRINTGPPLVLGSFITPYFGQYLYRIPISGLGLGDTARVNVTTKLTHYTYDTTHHVLVPHPTSQTFTLSLKGLAPLLSFALSGGSYDVTNFYGDTTTYYYGDLFEVSVSLLDSGTNPPTAYGKLKLTPQP